MKDSTVIIRVSKNQKEKIKKMSKDKEKTITEIIINLLMDLYQREYEK